MGQRGKLESALVMGAVVLRGFGGSSAAWEAEEDVENVY